MWVEVKEIEKFVANLFPKLVKIYIQKRYRPITMGVCDKSIQMDPLWNHTIKQDSDLIDLISEECNSGDLLMSFHEAVNLIWATRATQEIAGDIAELGTFSGSSAKLILSCSKSDKRKCYLFDTFNGIPEFTQGIDKVRPGEIVGKSLEYVKTKLEDFIHRVQFQVGFFPQTTANLDANVIFSFVNLDADTYLSTKVALDYFYDRLSVGGMILCHDYSSESCPGVKKAVDEFLIGKNEKLIPLWHSQCLIIKNNRALLS